MSQARDAAGAPLWVNVSERYGDRVALTMPQFEAACSANGWTLPMFRPGPGGCLVSATTGETVLVPVLSDAPEPSDVPRRRTRAGRVASALMAATPRDFAKLARIHLGEKANGLTGKERQAFILGLVEALTLADKLDEGHTADLLAFVRAL